MPPKRKKDYVQINASELLEVIEGTDLTSLPELVRCVDGLRKLATAAVPSSQCVDESVAASTIHDVDSLLAHIPSVTKTWPNNPWSLENKNEEKSAHHPELIQSFDLIINSWTWWNWEKCEAMCRTPIDLILIDRIAAHNERTPGAKLYVEGEQSITTICNVDGPKRKVISGEADYVLGYKDAQRDFNICNSFVAIDAKRAGTLDAALPQCSAYMVGIQQQRKQVDKSIQIVHGAVTNGWEWRFIRLDEEQNLSRSEICNMGEDRSRVFAFLDNILHAAARSSPITSPKKDASGRAERFESHEKFTSVVEGPHFRGLTNLPQNWQKLIVVNDDGDDELPQQ